jgi:rhodanese-related sulfurtransferase
MTQHIETHVLQQWLDTRQPVTVVDIRRDEGRSQWAIPGSMHVDAYDALRDGRAVPLADLVIPTDRPVVTVCNAGKVSQAAADVLAKRGFDARSLTGGMKAWSLAWNAADVDLRDPSVRVIQVRRTGKGCLSYVIAAGGEAAVIDPSLAPGIYLGMPANVTSRPMRAVPACCVGARRIGRWTSAGAVNHQPAVGAVE